MMNRNWHQDRDLIAANLGGAIVMTTYNHETYRVHILHPKR